MCQVESNNSDGMKNSHGHYVDHSSSNYETSQDITNQNYCSSQPSFQDLLDEAHSIINTGESDCNNAEFYNLAETNDNVPLKNTVNLTLNHMNLLQV